MQVSRKRSAPARNGVVTGSVWDSRMKNNEVKGGIKVTNGEENSEEGNSGGLRVNRRLKRNQSTGADGERKTSKYESVQGIETNPIQIRKAVSERRSIQWRKTRSESCKELSLSIDGTEKNPINIRKAAAERSPVQLRKTRSEPNKELSVTVDEIERNPIEVRNSRSDSHVISDETCKEMDICKEKIVSVSLSNVGQSESPGNPVTDDEGIYADEEYEEDEEEKEDMEMEIEIEKQSIDVKEVSLAEQKPTTVVDEEKPKIIVREEKKILQIHEKPVSVSANANKQPQPLHHKPKTVVKNENLLPQSHDKPMPISAKVHKQEFPVIDHHVIDSDLRKIPPTAVSEEWDRIPETQSKLQNIVELVMWRDVTRSAFVFGLGSFILLSSSYTKDLNFSLISTISYLGLVYLGAIFLYRSFVLRGDIDLDDSNQIYIVGEEEAIWILRLILPYLNEFLLKLKSLFCGDPATTMKLAVLLFVLARCGSSITIWKMAKLGFFGIFTVPKLCSSYSTQLTGYGQFWIRRFHDGWASCAHKKVVAAAIFTLVWNLSSSIARVWAVFMLVVAVRYYQQSLLSEEEWGAYDEGRGGQDCGSWPNNSVEILLKEKKRS